MWQCRGCGASRNATMHAYTVRLLHRLPQRYSWRGLLLIGAVEENLGDFERAELGVLSEYPLLIL